MLFQNRAHLASTILLHLLNFYCAICWSIYFECLSNCLFGSAGVLAFVDTAQSYKLVKVVERLSELILTKAKK